MADAPLCATGCGRPSPAARLCAPCTTSLRSALELAASIAIDLDDAIGRQLRRGGGGGKRSDSDAGLPIDLDASDATGALRNCLSGWVRVIAEAEPRWPLPPDTVFGMATWLAGRTRRWISQHEAAADIHREVRDAVARAAAVLESRPELHPAGRCAACARQLLAELGADTARCACGATVTGIVGARAKRAADADVLGTPDEVSLRLQLAGYTVAPGTIRMLSSRGRLVQRPGGRYSLGDVLEWARERDERMSRGRPV